MCLHNTEKGSSYRAPRQYTTSRRYTYTMLKWGSSYRAPSQYTTARRYTYTVPKGAAATQRLASTLPSEDVPTQYRKGSSYRAPRQYTSSRRYTYTMPKWGSSYTAPSQYTTIRRCTYTIPKKGQQLHGAWPAHYPQSSRSSEQPTIEAADHQTSPSADPHGT